MKWLIMPVLLLTLVPGSLWAADLDVCPTCTYTTLKAALSAAADGDRIRLAKGNYFETNTITNSLRVSIEGGWDSGFTTRSTDPADTVIDAMDAGRVLYVESYNGKTIELTLDGLTLTGGKAGGGGALYIISQVWSGTTDSTAKIALKNCILRNNLSTGNGGAIYTYASTSSDDARAVLDLNLENCRIIQNRALSLGGGLHIDPGSNTTYSQRTLLRLSVKGCRINGNEAQTGGGFYLDIENSVYEHAASSPGLQQNEICGNKAYDNYGAGYLRFRGGTIAAFDMVNNLVASNWDANGTGNLYFYSYDASPTLNFVNNTVTGNDGNGLRIHSRGQGGTKDDFTFNLENSIVTGNQLVTGQADLYLDNETDGNLVVNSRHNILGTIQPNDATITHSDVNLTSDPGLGDDYYPLAGSPAVDHADASTAPATDKDGNARGLNPDDGALERGAVDHEAVSAPPERTYAVSYPATKKAVATSNPLAGRAFALGDLGSGNLSLYVRLPSFTQPVDIYLNLYVPAVDSVNLWQLPALQPMTDNAPLKWKSGQTAAVDEAVFGDIPLSSLSALKGRWYFTLEVFPQNLRGKAVYRYETWADIR